MCSTDRRQLRNFIWSFKCDCGNIVEVASGDVRSGKTSSCGCLQKELSGKRMKAIAPSANKARAVHSMTSSPEFITWSAMRQRCGDPGNDNYASYGGRGIKVCDRWIDSFENFFADMGSRPKGTSLDRIDNEGHYEPGNCRWATPKEQGNNRRTNVRLTYKGQERTIAEWASTVGCCPKAFAYRVRSGWCMEKALTVPFDRTNRNQGE